jgi:hypothetical protein
MALCCFVNLLNDKWNLRKAIPFPGHTVSRPYRFQAIPFPHLPALASARSPCTESTIEREHTSSEAGRLYPAVSLRVHGSMTTVMRSDHVHRQFCSMWSRGAKRRKTDEPIHEYQSLSTVSCCIGCHYHLATTESI